MPTDETFLTIYDFSLRDDNSEVFIWAVEDDGKIVLYECMVRYERWLGWNYLNGDYQEVRTEDKYEENALRVSEYPEGEWDTVDVDYELGSIGEKSIQDFYSLIFDHDGSVLRTPREKREFSDHMDSLDVIFGGKELTQVVDLYGDPLPSKDSPLREDIVKLAKAEGKEFDRLISEYGKRLGKEKVDRG